MKTPSTVSTLSMSSILAAAKVSWADERAQQQGSGRWQAEHD